MGTRFNYMYPFQKEKQPFWVAIQKATDHVILIFKGGFIMTVKVSDAKLKAFELASSLSGIDARKAESIIREAELIYQYIFSDNKEDSK